MTEDFEDPDAALDALEGLVETIVRDALALPAEARSDHIAHRTDAMRATYQEHFKADPEGLEHGLEMALRIEQWCYLRLAELEQSGPVGRG